MRFETTAIPGLFAITLEFHTDPRGSFSRLFCEDEFGQAGLETRFAQQSLSLTHQAGTVRGMHYQTAPHEEVKFIRCVRGALYDVVADLRPDSPAYRRWQAFHLSPGSNLALYIPKGCAHGFQTLVDETEMLYQMSVPFAPHATAGFRYDDQAIGIEWPHPITLIADKDLAWPLLPTF